MMDGYSVTEAASVLGVPTERVWELLARGVLAGRPEGDTGMRVFLQPRSQPAAPVPAPDEPAPRGNGSERAELSPFRELLTEFRNLTERYGQALLALGEARGEVASLRSRVDVLEARMELRLPFGGQTAPAAWPMPATPVDAAPPVTPSHEVDEEDPEAHRSRRRGARRATESFAEALARAEDPSIPDLPGGNTAAALAAQAASQPEATERPIGGEPSLPREVAPAEAVPVADEAEPMAAIEPEPVVEIEPEPVVEIEPEPVAEPEPLAVGESIPSEAAEVEAVSAASVEGEEEPAAPSDELEADLAEAVAVPDAPDRAEIEPVASAVDVGPAEPVGLEPPPVEVDIEARDVPVASEETEATSAVEPMAPTPDAPAVEPAEPIDFDEDRYTTAIELPDWFEAEVEPSELGAMPAEPQPQPDPGAVASSGPSPEAEQEPAIEEEAVAADAEPESVLDASAGIAELEEEASAPSGAPEREAAGAAVEREEDSGAAEMEVAGGGPTQAAAAEPGPHAAAEPLPGSTELDEALAALEELRERTRTTHGRDEWPPASAGVVEATQPGSPPAARPGPVMSGGAANRAYRRLRRIFPE